MNLIRVIGLDTKTIGDLRRLEQYKEKSRILFNKRIRENQKHIKDKK